MVSRALSGALILLLVAVPAAATLCLACAPEHCPIVKGGAGGTPALRTAEAGETPALPAPCHEHAAQDGTARHSARLAAAPGTADCCALSAPSEPVSAVPQATDGSFRLLVVAVAAPSAPGAASGRRQGAPLRDERRRVSQPLYTLHASLLL